MLWMLFAFDWNSFNSAFCRATLEVEWCIGCAGPCLWLLTAVSSAHPHSTSHVSLAPVQADKNQWDMLAAVEMSGADIFFQGCPCGAWCCVVGEQEMAQLLRGRSTSSAHLETETDCNISSSCSVQQQLQHWWRKGSVTFHFLHLQQWDNHVQLLLSDGCTLGLLSKVQPLPWHRAGGGCRTGWTYLTRGKWWFARLLSSSKEKHLRCLRAGLLSKWQTSGNLIKFNKD